MAERSLRGTNLSTLSHESDEGITFSERQMVRYECPQGHISELPFSVEAEIPSLWECRCGEEALLVGGGEPDRKPVKPARTHWDMLLERRTIPELEELLQERLELLRASRGEKTKRSA